MAHEKLSVQLHDVQPHDVEKTVDQDIEDFNDFFKGLGNESMVRSERAILKTFYAWKLGLAKGG